MVKKQKCTVDNKTIMPDFVELAKCWQQALKEDVQPDMDSFLENIKQGLNMFHASDLTPNADMHEKDYHDNHGIIDADHVKQHRYISCSLHYLAQVQLIQAGTSDVLADRYRFVLPENCISQLLSSKISNFLWIKGLEILGLSPLTLFGAPSTDNKQEEHNKIAHLKNQAKTDCYQHVMEYVEHIITESMVVDVVAKTQFTRSTLFDEIVSIIDFNQDEYRKLKEYKLRCQLACQHYLGSQLKLKIDKVNRLLRDLIERVISEYYYASHSDDTRNYSEISLKLFREIRSFIQMKNAIFNRENMWKLSCGDAERQSEVEIASLTKHILDHPSLLQLAQPEWVAKIFTEVHEEASERSCVYDDVHMMYKYGARYIDAVTLQSAHTIIISQLLGEQGASLDASAWIRLVSGLCQHAQPYLDANIFSSLKQLDSDKESVLQQLRENVTLSRSSLLIGQTLFSCETNTLNCLLVDAPQQSTTNTI